LKSLILSSCLLLTLPGVAFGETHKDVQAALDYQLRENTCSKPKVIASNTAASAPAQAAGSASFFVGTSTTEVTEVDSYTRRRQERKESRWRSCVAEYKANLLNDMEELKSSARHGITRAQANTILTNMAMIQEVYLTTDGVLEQPEEVENSEKSDN